MSPADLPLALPAHDPSQASAAPAPSSFAPGVNISPGHEDDGWIIPPPAVIGDGSQVQLYKDGEALQIGYEAIRQAKHRICLEVYIFASDQTGRAFADLLCRKAREGVEVYVIYDSFGSIRSDRRMFERMRQSGVHLQEFHPIRPWEAHYSWRPVNRDHRKLLLIDDQIAGMGGLNIGAEYAGSWVVSGSTHGDFWRDNAVGIVGPSARMFLGAFAATWRYITHGGRIGGTEFVHNLGPFKPKRRPPIHGGTRRWETEHTRILARRPTFAGTSAGYRGAMARAHDAAVGEVGVLASAPTISSPLWAFFSRLLSDARQSIHITMAYFAPSDVLINELCNAARRGVQVRLMLPGRCDVPLLVTAARSFYDRLMSAGVEIYERQGAMLHAKTLLIDGQTTVMGSINLDYRSVEYNCELSVLIRSRAFGQNVRALFENDVGYALRVNPVQWRRRPWRDRLVQWAVNRARYIL